jgi:hypothetical protein
MEKMNRFILFFVLSFFINRTLGAQEIFSPLEAEHPLHPHRRPRLRRLEHPSTPVAQDASGLFCVGGVKCRLRTVRSMSVLFFMRANF